MARKTVSKGPLQSNSPENFCLDDVRHLHAEDYRNGRKSRDLGLPDSENPIKNGDRRTAWYLGWWDAFFYPKYGAPWPAGV